MRSRLNSLTLPKKAAEMPSKGLTARMTRVSFHPWMNPIMKDVMNVV